MSSALASSAPPTLAMRRALVARVRARLGAAAGLPPREALGEISAALRDLCAALPPPRDERLEAFVRECDEILYSPDATAVGDLDVAGPMLRRVLRLPMSPAPAIHERPPRVLSDEQRESFLRDGFVYLRGAFPRALAAELPRRGIRATRTPGSEQAWA